MFHEITLTSASCAFMVAPGDFPKRVSHMATVPSTEHEAKTLGTVGLHCTNIGKSISQHRIKPKVLLS